MMKKATKNMGISLLIILLVMVGCNSETYEPIAEPIEEATGTNENSVDIRHFIFTEIQGINLVENPNLADGYLFFVADIGMGYEAEITIQRESERLVGIETFFRQSGIPRG